MSQLRKLERRERADLGRLDDHRVARGQARCHLPREHHQRVVPRGDQAANPDGFALGDAEIPVEETRYTKGTVQNRCGKICPGNPKYDAGYLYSSKRQ